MPFKSPSDRFTWLILMLVFIAAFLSVAVNFETLHQIRQRQTDAKVQVAQELSVIKQNQLAETVATKTYIACLLTINPAKNVPAQEHTCFDKAPVVKE